MAVGDGAGSSVGTRPRLANRLSERETEIAALVAQGLTNRQIAARLTITPATVTSHIGHILTKLDARRRSQIAAFAAELGLDAGTPRAVDLRPPADPAAPAPELPRPRSRRGITLSIAGAAAALALAAAFGLRSRPGPPPPARGDALFGFDPSRGGGQFKAVVLHAGDEPQGSNPFRFGPEGALIAPDVGFPLLVADAMGVGDVVAAVRAKEVEGLAHYVIQLRGCSGDPDDFYRVNVEPRTGMVSIERARCGPGFVLNTMLAPSPRLAPVEAGAEEDLTVALRGQTIGVYSGGHLVGQGTDAGPPLPPGTARFGVYNGGSVLLSGFDLYRPA